jgi:hypothetical protein
MVFLTKPRFPRCGHETCSAFDCLGEGLILIKENNH